MVSATISAIATAFPRQIRRNAWWHDNYPDLVAHAREATLAKLWADFEDSEATIDGLRGISSNGSLRIGALTTQAEVERSSDVDRQAPLLSQAVRHIGHPVIRNLGTVGGSIAHADPAAELPLVMVATAGWFQQLMACPGPQRIQVLDEAWALLGNRHTAAYLQSCFKLGRTYGVANVCITHRASDLTAQADDGSATSKIAAGLLADSATKIVLRQAPDQVAAAVAHFGLTDPEARIIGALTRGRALWRIGGRAAVVQHLLTHREAVELCDTDQSMRARGRQVHRAA